MSTTTCERCAGSGYVCSDEVEVVTLADRLARLVCRVLGHDWRTWAPKEGTPAACILGRFVMCRRCGQLDR